MILRDKSRRARRPSRRPGIGSDLALEARRLLDGGSPGLMISEFVASNKNGLKDQDGDASDWLEVYNPTAGSIDLTGWGLTDDSAVPRKWLFPSESLAAGGFLVVFASGKNRAAAGSELHASFKIGASGGYLALDRPDGTVADVYDSYPQQYTDVSYGHPFGTTYLVGAGAPATYKVPTDGSLGTTWTGTRFTPDASWSQGPTGLSYGMVQPGFTVHYVESTLDLTDLATVKTMLATPSEQLEARDATPGVINYLDTGPSGNFGDDNPFPGQDIGVDNDRFALQANGTIRIPASGDWTFGVNSDDGFELVLTGNGQTYRMAYDAPRAPGDTLATFNLAAGDYAAQLVYFENNGWASLEFFAAQGAKDSMDGSFRLVGDAASGGLAVSSPPSDPAVIATDVGPAMAGRNATAYVRLPFDASDPSAFDTLALKIRYDDGFVAYLNGVEVARRNAPAATSWSSAATASRGIGDALGTEIISLTDKVGLLESGTNVLAIQALNASASDSDFLLLPELVATSIDTTRGSYFKTPTPGDFNGQPYLGVAADVSASTGRGFFSSPFDLTLGTATAGASIYFTTDGSTPSPTNGTLYAGPIHIAGTTALRAVAFLDGYIPSHVESDTYIFVADVIHQSEDGSPPPGWPSASNGRFTINYGMDPTIVDDPTYGGQALEEALKAIPTISISTDLSNLFDPATGIYANPYGKGDDWERAASVELINPDGSQGFQINAGLRIRGGYSRSTDNPKHAFRLFFNNDYDGALDFPLFGSEGVSEFAKLDLRTDQNYSWSFDGSGANTAVREVFSRDVMRDMGDPYTRSRYYQLYIDGQYWGLYQSEERPEANWAASYYGGSKDDYDVIKVENYSYDVYATDGNLDAWTRLYNAAVAGFSSNADYYRIQGKNPDGTANPAYEDLLDVDNLIDYMQTILFTGNFDAPISAFLGNERPNNFYAFRDRTGQHGGFRFVTHDSEHTLFDVNEDRNGPWPAGSTLETFNPQWLHQQLMASPEYRQLFADHARKNFFDGGALTADSNIARFQARAAQIVQAIDGESARWGDSRREPAYTPADWQNAINYVLHDYFPARNAVVLGQLRSNGLFPGLDFPEFYVNGVVQDGGRVPSGTKVHLSALAGRVYYTTDGTDPRLIGGAISPSATLFDPATSADLVLTGTTRLEARAFDGTTWSAIQSADFQVNDPASADNLVVTELNYSPYPAADTSVDRETFEFIELRNVGARELDLTGVRITDGVTFAFPAGTYLAPGAYIVVVHDLAAFRSRYGNAPTVAGAYAGSFSNKGEHVQIVDAAGADIANFAYSNKAPWPTAPDGKGASLVAVATAPRSDLNSASSWRASVDHGGSPGSLGDTAPDLAAPDAAATDEDTPANLAITVADAETGAAGVLVTATSDNPALLPAGGLVLGGAGSARTLALTPAKDQSGKATITVTADDGQGGVTTRTFVLTVNPVDDPPVAADDSYAGDEDSPIRADAAHGVLVNDTDVDSPTLSAILVAPPKHGTVDLYADGSFTYVPDAYFHGTDGFTYVASDGQAQGPAATVSLVLRFVNHAPVAAADAYATDEDTPLLIGGAGGVLADDADVDGNDLAAQLVSTTSHGTLTLHADGGFFYMPDPDYNGTDSFRYRASDGASQSAVVTVSLTVRPVDDPPLLGAIAVQTVVEGSTLHFTATARDVDTPAGGLTFSLADGHPAGMTIDPKTGVITWKADRGPQALDVGVDVRDDAAPGVVSHGDVTIKVLNVAPTVDAGPDGQAEAGSPFAASGSFDDPGTESWSATVDYGDGTPAASLPLDADKSFRLSHVYAAAGSYTVTVGIGDGTATGVDSLVVTVSPPPDRTPPVLVAVSSTSSKKAVTGLALAFSEPIAGGTATNVDAYRLVQAGRDRKFGTKDDVVVRLRSATLDGSGTHVILAARKKLQANRKYQLQVSGSGATALTDAAGNALDGDGDALAGGDAVRRFTVARDRTVRPASLAVPSGAAARRLHASRSSRFGAR
ncbi:CotH protein [Aquisphaera giovannonii]|uniref:CotH protein n=1 Tax=Aquisphaera giovannonii TaxID=406548 RepID=A0A5B9WD77_9BACT|nr:Ig-like domain-containing protein [Aquisphaera giovannonii]QEH37901.1 CotH protein [Aquisphaera giovannonii]